MITETTIHSCPDCHSCDLVKNGHTIGGKQQFRCKACGRTGVLNPSEWYTEAEKERILAAYFERPSMRGVCRIFGVSRPTLAKWLKDAALAEPDLAPTLADAEATDVLELDEVWSFVQRRKNKRWLWVALCRRTRQVVAYALGDRSEKTCRKLWEAIPESYRACHTYSDLWEAYRIVFPAETHRCIGKETGLTNHVERWNNTLRQWVSRYTRKTLSFSKSDRFHDWVTHLFICRYNKAQAF